MSAREAAAPHNSDGHRSVQLLGKLPELPVGSAPDHTAAADEQRPPGLGNHLHQGFNVPFVGLRSLQLVAGGQGLDGAAGAVPAPRDKLIVDLHTGKRNIFQEIDEHRAGPAGGRHGKCLTHHVRDGLGVPDQIGGFGNRHSDAGNVHLLKGVLPQRLLRHIAGDEHNGRRVHIGGGNPGDQICGARAAGSETDPHFPGGTGIAVGGVSSPLLMGGQDMVDPILIVIQLIIEIQDRSTWISENSVHLLLQQTLHDGLSGAYFQNG